MLNKEELYTKEIKNARAEALSSENIKGKLLLILNLFFAIVIISYLIYIIAGDSDRNYTKTKVLGVSYMPEKVKYDETELLEQQLKSVEIDTLNSAIKNSVRYNNTKNQVIIMGKNSDNEQYENIRVVDDNGEYKGATVVDDKDGYIGATVVEDRDEYQDATIVNRAL
jgi:hypothetical protein